MRPVSNQLLQQVLLRRRLRRRARFSALAWVLFGGLHIAVWWAAFSHNQTFLPQPVLDELVWPLLLAATAAFVVMLYFTARWFLAPSDPQNYEWLEAAEGNAAPNSSRVTDPEPALPQAV